VLSVDERQVITESVTVSPTEPLPAFLRGAVRPPLKGHVWSPWGASWSAHSRGRTGSWWYPTGARGRGRRRWVTGAIATRSSAAVVRRSTVTPSGRRLWERCLEEPRELSTLKPSSFLVSAP
jgi:hypothetical protein